MKYEIAPKSTELEELNWNDAILYCFSLNVDGKTGWRLPTNEELNEIYESANDFEKDTYWSSTDEIVNGAWCQYFGDGNRFNGHKNFGNYYVRAIRDLKDD